jgi:hypothetical protein
MDVKPRGNYSKISPHLKISRKRHNAFSNGPIGTARGPGRRARTTGRPMISLAETWRSLRLGGTCRCLNGPPKNTIYLQHLYIDRHELTLIGYSRCLTGCYKADGPLSICSGRTDKRLYNGEHGRSKMTTSYSKCNADFARSGLSSANSTDSMRTSFRFLTKPYISLHENVAGPPKFCRNGRSQEAALEDSSYRHKNLASFDQNLAVFGRWKGAGPTFYINQRRFINYVNQVPHRPSSSSQIIPRKRRPFVAAMGVAQDCAVKSIDTTFTALCFLGALHFLAAKRGSTLGFLKNSTVADAGIAHSRDMSLKNGENRGVKPPKTRKTCMR